MFGSLSWQKKSWHFVPSDAIQCHSGAVSLSLKFMVWRLNLWFLIHKWSCRMIHVFFIKSLSSLRTQKKSCAFLAGLVLVRLQITTFKPFGLFWNLGDRHYHDQKKKRNQSIFIAFVSCFLFFENGSAPRRVWICFQQMRWPQHVPKLVCRVAVIL